MKKFYMILAALLIGSVCFAQKAQGPALQVKAQSPNQTRSGYYNYYEDDGSGYVGINLYTAGDKLAARYPVSSLATLGANPQLTKVELGFYEYTYQGTQYNNKTVNIVVYQGGVFDEEQGLYTTNPTQVYSQAVTATQQGYTEFTLTTPVNIDVTQELLVAVEMTGNTCYVMAHSDVPSAENLGNIMWYQNQWVAMDFYTDDTQTETECTPWYINIYIADENAYVENSDITAGFMAGETAPYSAAEANITLGANDPLTVYPYIQNIGPDATTNSVNVTLTVNNVELISQPIDLSGEYSLQAGYFTFIYAYTDDPNPSETSEFHYDITLTAEELDQMNLPSTFDVCLTATYAGVDNNANNNTACLHITRNVTSVEENIAEAVSVYPNPANDMFTVANAEGATIVVVNSLGQVVASIENAASNQTIDASNFANGTYFVKVNESVVKINVVK